jgi:hypothetical protein
MRNTQGSMTFPHTSAPSVSGLAASGAPFVSSLSAGARSASGLPGHTRLVIAFAHRLCAIDLHSASTPILGDYLLAQEGT